jgi:hypothetical protein
MAEIGVKAIARRTSRSSRAWCVANSRQPRNEDDIVRPSPKKGSAMMQLYWSPRSRSFSSLWLFEETGQPYERVLTDISTGAQRKLEYLAINPMGKVPALKDGEATLAEAAAICAYVSAIPCARSISTGCSSAPDASSLRSCNSPPRSR